MRLVFRFFTVSRKFLFFNDITMKMKMQKKNEELKKNGKAAVVYEIINFNFIYMFNFLETISKCKSCT
jgi:hypothetical protein